MTVSFNNAIHTKSWYAKSHNHDVVAYILKSGLSVRFEYQLLDHVIVIDHLIVALLNSAFQEFQICHQATHKE
jgi:hypothetical protein